MSWDKDFIVSDDFGNSLTFREKTLYLKLSSENRTRQIGKVNKLEKENIFFYHKENMKESVHVLRKNDSWGLHWDVVNSLPDDAFVLIESDKDTYCIKIKKAKEVGEFLWFKNQGFEKQFFVAKKHWTIKEK